MSPNQFQPQGRGKTVTNVLERKEEEKEEEEGGGGQDRLPKEVGKEVAHNVTTSNDITASPKPAAQQVDEPTNTGYSTLQHQWTKRDTYQEGKSYSVQQWQHIIVYFTNKSNINFQCHPELSLCMCTLGLNPKFG